MSLPLHKINQLISEQKYEEVICLTNDYKRQQSMQITDHVHASFQQSQKAIKLLENAIIKWPDDISLKQDLASLYYDQGEYRKSLDVYKILDRHTDTDMLVLLNIALCHLSLNDFNNAKAYASRIIIQAKDNHNAWCILGLAHFYLHEIEEAHNAFYASVFKGEPKLPIALNYLHFCERHNKIDQLVNGYFQLPKSLQDHPQAMIEYAKALRHQKKYRQALNILTQVKPKAYQLSVSQKAGFHFELGHNLDRNSQYTDAYAAFEMANHLVNQTETSLNSTITVDDLLHKQRKLSPHTLGDPIQDSPVFILGFPRSGSTLIEYALNANSSVQTFEEMPVLSQLIEQNLSNFEHKTQFLKKQYYQIFKEVIGWSDHRRLVDRNAYHSVILGYISHLFPNAPYIFLQRHPLDVVLSCFMQDFTPTFINREFHQLNSTVEIYCAVMDFVFAQIEQKNLHLHILKYEDLIVDFEGETKKMFEFLQLDWNSDVNDFWKRAQSKPHITTASYNQVTQPLYNSSSYRWKNYKMELAPYMERLKPYCDKMGYSTED